MHFYWNIINIISNLTIKNKNENHMKSLFIVNKDKSHYICMKNFIIFLHNK